MPRNAIYYTDYNYAGIDYRLEIIPADSADLSSPAMIEVSESSLIKVDNQNSKFSNKLPVGLVSAGSLKITFDLLKCPDDLVDYLIEPYISISKSVAVNPTGGAAVNKTYDLELSNLYVLKYYNGTEHITLFVGSQKKTVKRKYSVNKQLVSAEYEIIDIAHVIYTQTKSKMIAEAMLSNAQVSNFEAFYDSVAYDHLFKGSGINQFTYAIADGFKNPETGAFDVMFGFMKLSDLMLQINIIAEQLLKLYYRGAASITTHGNIMSGIKYYKQYVSDNSHAKGAELAYSNLLFIAAYQKTNVESQVLSNPNGGFLSDNENDIDNLYNYETGWDFIKTLSETKFIKAVFSYTERGIKLNYLRLKEKNPDNSLINPNYTFAIGNKTVYEEGSEIIRKMQVNTNSGDNDDEEFYFTNQGSTSDKDYEYEHVFHNMPTVPESGKLVIKTDNIVEPTYRLQVFVTQSVNTLKLYYKHSLNSDIALKAHESVSIDDGESVTDYNNTRTYEYIPTNLASVKGVTLSFQREMTELIAFVNHYGELYGRYNQTIWEAEFKINEEEYSRIMPFNTGDKIEFDNNIDFLLNSASYPYAFKKVYQVFSKKGAVYRKGVVIDITANYSKGTAKAKILILGES